MSLKDYDTKALEKELARREEEKKNRPPNYKPYYSCDFSDVYKFALSLVKEMDETGYPIKDYECQFFESVMEAIYGADFWDWWNRKT